LVYGNEEESVDPSLSTINEPLYQTKFIPGRGGNERENLTGWRGQLFREGQVKQAETGKNARKAASGVVPSTGGFAGGVKKNRFSGGKSTHEGISL